ncbi:MAG: lysylphosphatidylglycerol synthase transmembrane domain-containing protein [Nocardioidaceae bacterium]
MDAVPLPRGRTVIRYAATAALTAAALVLVLPRAAGVSWTVVGDTLRGVGLASFVPLTVVWFGGLLVYSGVLSGSLPGLSRRRALTLNLTGSAVANALPGGGAFAIALNWAMLRGWGFTMPAFVGWTVLTNVMDVGLKLALPIGAVALLLLSGIAPGAALLTAAAGCCAFWLFAALVGSILFKRRSTRSDRLPMTGRPPMISRLVPRAQRERLAAAVSGSQGRAVEVFVHRWPRLILGTLGYAAAHIALLAMTLHVLGGSLGLPQVIAGYAVERLITLVPLTPGGAGFAEAGLAACLIALGGVPAPTTAAVVVFRALTFGLEIPVGGLLLAAWATHRRFTRRTNGSPVCASPS